VLVHIPNFLQELLLFVLLYQNHVPESENVNTISKTRRRKGSSLSKRNCKRLGNWTRVRKCADCL